MHSVGLTRPSTLTCTSGRQRWERLDGERSHVLIHLFICSPTRCSYAEPRFVTHIDDMAIKALTEYYAESFPPSGSGAKLLDVCSSWISHYPEGYSAARISGTGMNDKELQRNSILSDYSVKDLNEDPTLPYPDGEFDVVTNTVSIDYLTKPLEIMREINRYAYGPARFLLAWRRLTRASSSFFHAGCSSQGGSPSAAFPTGASLPRPFRFGRAQATLTMPGSSAATFSTLAAMHRPRQRRSRRSPHLAKKAIQCMLCTRGRQRISTCRPTCRPCPRSEVVDVHPAGDGGEADFDKNSLKNLHELIYVDM